MKTTDHEPQSPTGKSNLVLSLIVHGTVFLFFVIGMLLPGGQAGGGYAGVYDEPMLVQLPDEPFPVMTPEPEVIEPEPTPAKPDPTPEATPEPEEEKADKEITTEDAKKKKPTPTPKATKTPKPTVKPTNTPTPEKTAKPTATPKPTAEPTPKPTATPKATKTPKPEATATPKPKATEAPKPTATPKPTPVSLTPEQMRALYQKNKVSSSGQEPKKSTTIAKAANSSASGSSSSGPGRSATGKPGGNGSGQGSGSGKGSGNGVGSGTGKGLKVTSSGLPDYYEQGALQAVSRFFTVPNDQQKNVTAVVEFRILRNGTITDIRLKRSCGTDSLDQRAIDALKKTKKFSPLPDSVTDDSIRHEMAFAMTL